jgi:hypothetical protein
VQRQDTGTTGRIENAQVAVYLVDATSAGRAVIDRRQALQQGAATWSASGYVKGETGVQVPPTPIVLTG